MKLHRSVFATMSILALFAVGLIVSGTGSTDRQVLRLSDKQVIRFDNMVEELKGKRVTYIGELHDRDQHHAVQLDIVKAFQRERLPFVIGLEMFSAESQPYLDQWVEGTLDVNSFIEIYKSQWDLPWQLYKDIFLYAREHRIPLIGLNLPRQIVRKVSREGFAALTEDERKRLPAGITCVVDPAYRRFIAEAFSHGHVTSERSFEFFCQAQMLWNKSMGRHLQEYLSRNPNSSAIVLTGSGHALKQGMPEEVFRETGNRYSVVLPEMPGFERTSVTAGHADYLVLEG